MAVDVDQLKDAAERAIREMIRRRTDSAESAELRTVLYTGNWQDPIPRHLIHNPLLDPTSKLIWMVLRTYVEPTSYCGFPDQVQIAEAAGRRTDRRVVSRSIDILHMRRWITIIQRKFRHEGRVVGNVYYLHDEPLSIADAIALDPEYVDFVASKAQHHWDTVARTVAREVLEELREVIDLDFGPTQLRSRDPNDSSSLQPTTTLQQMGRRLSTQSPGAGLSAFFAQKTRSPVASRAQQLPLSEPCSDIEHGPCSNTEHGYNNSSNDQDITITNQGYSYDHEEAESAPEVPETAGKADFSTEPLLFPGDVIPNALLQLLQPVLERAPSELVQQIVWELAGRIRQKGKAIEPVSYLNTIVSRALEGQFFFSGIGQREAERYEQVQRAQQQKAAAEKAATAVETEAVPSPRLRRIWNDLVDNAVREAGPKLRELLDQGAVEATVGQVTLYLDSIPVLTTLQDKYASALQHRLTLAAGPDTKLKIVPRKRA